MKLIIAGGRDYHLTTRDIRIIDKIHINMKVSEVVSGGCKGVDIDGEQWATDNSVSIKRFVADWDTHGKYAGPRRNKQMAEYADALVVFPGGKGTRNMYDEANKLSLTIFDCRQL